MPDIADLLERTLPAAAPPPLEAVGRRVVRRRRRRRGAAAGAALAVVAILGAGVAVRNVGESESQRVVTSPDGRVLTEPVGSWRQAADPPFGPRSDAFTATTDDERILVWGGNADRGGESGGGEQTDGGIYDAEADEWDTIDPAPFPTGVTGTGAQFAGGRLAVIGWLEEGASITRYLAIYDVEEGRWTTVPDLVVGGAMAWDGTRMAFAEIDPGYTDETSDSVPRTQRWTFGDDHWEAGAPYPFGLQYGAATVANTGNIAVWGGTTTPPPGPASPTSPGADREVTDAGAIYDVAQDEWEPIPQGPIGPRTQAAVLWQGGHLVLGGGSRQFGDEGPPVEPTVAVFDPATEAWTTVPDPPVSGSFDLRRSAAGVVFVDPYEGLQGVAFLENESWAEPPRDDLNDLYRLDGLLVAPSNRMSNPGNRNFSVSIRNRAGVWLESTVAPFHNRAQAAIGTSGTRMLVVGGFGSPTLAWAEGAWVFDLAG